MLEQYFAKITELLQMIEQTEATNIREAAQKVARSLQQGEVIHLFGSGHSHILTEEVFYRAGGLAPIRPILIEPLMLHVGAARSSELERQNDYAEQFMKDEDIRAGEVFFVISTSGRNGVPIDVAMLGKQRGAFVIGITSRAYASSQPSRHNSGKYLHDVVDLVIDNHAPVGDALLSHEKVSVPFAPASTVVGAAILNAVFAEAIAMMAKNGYEPPVFLSGNIEGAEAHNKRLIEKYRKRIWLL